MDGRSHSGKFYGCNDSITVECPQINILLKYKKRT